MPSEPKTGLTGAASWLGDRLTDWTGLVAIRVPLEKANGAAAESLCLPGYVQTNSYGCGAVAAAMVVRYFHPQMDFGTIYEAVAPDPQTGVGPIVLARALCTFELGVERRGNLSFNALCQAIDSGRPVLLVIRNPGADCRHWVVVYGYSRKPDHLYVAGNGLPLLKGNRVLRRRLERLWEPKGNGLICWRKTRSARRRAKVAKSK